LFTRK
jgi:hypothetical protein